MSSLSETMATNEKMRAWLERSIEELISGDWLEATGSARKRSDFPSQTTRQSVPYLPGPPMTLGNMRELGVRPALYGVLGRPAF
jgi:hypothetical protein